MFKEIIKDILKRLNITRKELSQRLHISNSYLSMLENGRQNAPSWIVKKIISEFGLSYNQIVSLHAELIRNKVTTAIKKHMNEFEGVMISEALGEVLSEYLDQMNTSIENSLD